MKMLFQTSWLRPLTQLLNKSYSVPSFQLFPPIAMSFPIYNGFLEKVMAWRAADTVKDIQL